MRDRRMRRLGPWGLAVVLLTAGLVIGIALSPSADVQSGSASADSFASIGQSLDIGLTGTASASTAMQAAPASNAIDGSASTEWCSTQFTGTLTIDLGKVQNLDGFGITLDASATTALVDMQYATTAGDWHPIAGIQDQSVPGAEPVYWPAPSGDLKARFVQLTVTDNDGTPPCVGELRLFQREPANVLPDRGADLSFLPQEEAAGARYTDDGVQQSALQILNNHGVNYVRLRLWVDPPPGYSNLASDLQMAKRIHAAGDKIYLDIHYSDFWADPSKQIVPAAWAGQDLDQLTTTVHDYTEQVISAFAQQNTPVDMVSIGNEIRNGMLWPFGQIDWTTDTGWGNLAQLLKAGVAGARAGNPSGHQLLVMMHFDEGGNNADSTHFYNELVANGVPFDVIGLSYYPFFHGPLISMKQNVDALAAQFHKPIVIAESQYPWTLAQADGNATGITVWNTGFIKADSQNYPPTPGGQLSFYNDMQSILAQVPDHLGLGLFYWEPEWIPGVGWEPGAGSPNVNLTLFSYTGQALPSVGLFQNPITVCGRYDPNATPCEVPDGATTSFRGF